MTQSTRGDVIHDDIATAPFLGGGLHMVIAVSRDASDSTYGDSAIYMGNGSVCQCTGGAIKTMTLSAWISSYGTLVTPKWGWLGNLAIA